LSALRDEARAFRRDLAAWEHRRLALQPCNTIGTSPAVISGTPNPQHVSTSYLERQNLRCGCRCAVYSR